MCGTWCRTALHLTIYERHSTLQRTVSVCCCSPLAASCRCVILAASCVTCSRRLVAGTACACCPGPRPVGACPHTITALTRSSVLYAAPPGLWLFRTWALLWHNGASVLRRTNRLQTVLVSAAGLASPVCASDLSGSSTHKMRPN